MSLSDRVASGAGGRRERCSAAVALCAASEMSLRGGDRLRARGSGECVGLVSCHARPWQSRWRSGGRAKAAVGGSAATPTGIFFFFLSTTDEPWCGRRRDRWKGKSRQRQAVEWQDPIANG